MGLASDVAKGAAETVAEDGVAAVVEGGAKTAVSAATSVLTFGIGGWIKLGIITALVGGLAYGGYRVFEFVQRAAADHAAVAVAVQAAKDNEAARVAAEAQHSAVVASATAARVAAEARAASLAETLENLKNAPHSSGCVPSNAARAALDRLRH